MNMKIKTEKIIIKYKKKGIKKQNQIISHKSII